MSVEDLSRDHPLAVLMAEHQVLLETLDQLHAAATESPPNVAGLRDASATLLAAEPHHQREEQTLFPRLVAAGVQGPPQIMEHEHRMLRDLKATIAELAEHAEPEEIGWQARTRETVGSLCNILAAHIHKENEILYPMALRTLTEWEEVRSECDAIGYCTFTPERG